MAVDKARVMGLVGFWSFIIGLIIAVVMGIFAASIPAFAPVAVIILVILGIIIGVLNITAKEVPTLLLATIALIVVGNAFAALDWFEVGKILGNVLSYVGILVAPAAVIAALKALWAIGKPGD